MRNKVPTKSGKIDRSRNQFVKSVWTGVTSVVALSHFSSFSLPGFREEKWRWSEPLVRLGLIDIPLVLQLFLSFKKSNIIPEATGQFWSLPSFSFLSFCFSKNSLEKFVLLRQEYWIFWCYSTRIQISSILSLLYTTFCNSLYHIVTTSQPTHSRLHFTLHPSHQTEYLSGDCLHYPPGCVKA